MTKVVINTCYGGFSLSHDAFVAYHKRKGIDVYCVATEGLLAEYYTVPIDQLPDYVRKGYIYMKPSEREDYKERQLDKLRLYQHNIRNEDRSDPDLVAVVEEMGDKANGQFAELKVVEIPDDVEWEIDEYDGYEHVAETHRTWS